MRDRRELDEEFHPLERAKLFIGHEPGKGVKTSFHICNKPFTEMFAGQPLKSSSRSSGTNPSTLRKSATLEGFVSADGLLVANWELLAVARACRYPRKLIPLIQRMNGQPSLRSPAQGSEEPVYTCS